MGERRKEEKGRKERRGGEGQVRNERGEERGGERKLEKGNKQVSD